jgi:hypothetical protein
MTDGDLPRPRRTRDIGFTFEEDGVKTLPTGQVVPRFKGKPNDLEAHRRAMAWVEKDIEEEEHA